MMDESSFVKGPGGAQLQLIKEPIEEVAMTTARSFAERDSTQTDLIRYFDRNLVTPDTAPFIDHFAIVARAHHERAVVMREMIGGGVAWLWRRLTHLGRTRSPQPRFHVESRVQF